VTTKNPPWDSMDERWWLAWVNQQFDALDAQAEVTADERAWDASVRLLASLPPTERSELLRKMGISVAKNRWHYGGEVAPLCKLFPEVAETFVPPPRWQQRHRQRDHAIKRQLLKLAVKDVYRIRKLWRDVYGMWKRPVKLKPSATRLAALRNDFSERELRGAMRHGSNQSDWNQPV
jgi:hypothetical protein